MRLLPLAFLSMSFLSSPNAFSAEPAANESLTAILENTCSRVICAEGYNVRFRQLAFEASKQQLTAALTLMPHQGIDYPILNEMFEAQIVQKSFAGICKIRNVHSMESILNEENREIQNEFLNALRACIGSLADRTDQGLGRNRS